MREFQKGNEEAFRLLFDRYSGHLINFAYRSLASKPEAEDLTQEVLIRVYRKRDRFDVSRLFRPWIFSIAARLVSNRIRDRKRHPQASLDFQPSDENQNSDALQIADSPSLVPDKELEQKKLAEAVWRSLDALPETQRSAIILAKFEEMPYEEIASVLNTSVSSVKSLLFRARESLKSSLEAYVQEKTQE